MVLSVLVPLILTPALCATLLKPVPNGSHGKTTGFFGWFNRTFDNGAERYERGLGRVIRSPKRAILLYGLLIIGLGAMFVRLPTGFLPEEDQGTIIALVQLPAGATAHRTTAVNDRSEEHTSELQSLMRIPYAVFCLKKNK